MAEKRKAGRPQWAPTERDRRQVSQLASIGVGLDDIAAILDITIPTLKKHCYIDLQKGKIMGRARNTKRLHEAAEKGNVTAMIWLDKTRFNISDPSDQTKKALIEEESKIAPRGTQWDGLLQ